MTFDCIFSLLVSVPLYYALVSAAHLLIYFGAGDSGDSETGSIGEATAEFSDSKSEEDVIGDAKGKLIKNLVCQCQVAISEIQNARTCKQHP